jgi:hypothetical protein
VPFWQFSDSFLARVHHFRAARRAFLPANTLGRPVPANELRPESLRKVEAMFRSLGDLIIAIVESKGKLSGETFPAVSFD